MEKGKYILFKKYPEKDDVVFRHFNSADNFKVLPSDVELSKVAYAVLSNSEDEDTLEAKLIQREQLNSLVFKSDINLDDLDKDYSWEFDGEYLKPSIDLVKDVEDLRDATLWFCINRIWQESKRCKDGNLILIIPKEYDEETGFSTIFIRIPAHLIDKCRSIVEVKSMLHTYMRMHPTTIPQED